jgi:hypothetical protein
MTLSNAEKQRRWRDKRNAMAEVIKGTPPEIAIRRLELLRKGRPQVAAKWPTEI